MLTIATPIEAMLCLVQLDVNGLDLFLNYWIFDLEDGLSNLVVPPDGEVEISDIVQQSVVLFVKLSRTFRNVLCFAQQEILDFP